MKRKFITMIAALLFITASVFSQDFIENGYITLEGPTYWNDSYVKYTLKTDNEKGGKAKTLFEDKSFDKLLQSFEYNSKDYFQLSTQKENILDKIEVDTWPITELSWLLPRFSYSFSYLYDSPLEDIIEEIDGKFEAAKNEIKENYIESIKKIEDIDNVRLLDKTVPSTSYIYISYSRYVDSRDGYFTIYVYLVETDETFYFRIDNSTDVYYGDSITSNSKPKTYNNLDEKVLAICSEIAINKKIIFGITKDDVLKEYKNCGFVLITETSK